jgi:hypothetical protein
MDACDLLAVEHRLDRIDGVLARELPPHVRALARSYARGEPAPPAPELLHRPDTLAAARAALAHPVLADRGLALLRLVAPLAIARDAALAYALPPTWATLAVLAQARDAAARARFGRRALDVIHALHGSPDGARGAEGAGLARGIEGAGAARGVEGAGAARGVEGAGAARGVEGAGAARGVEGAGAARGVEGAGSARGVEGAGSARGSLAGAAGEALPPAIPAWLEPDGVSVDDAALARAWEALRGAEGVAGSVRFERAAARPRCFTVAPGAEVVVVVPARIAAPAERFAVLHELGHAVAALGSPAGIPRVVDEAAAAAVARALEAPDHPWHSPHAIAARQRRVALARWLDRLERALPALPDAHARPAERPPWALWHDPGAQAAYVAAEALADTLAPGRLVAGVAEARAAIDRRDPGW